MAQYIDKAAIVAEIERLKECNRKICGGDFDFLKKAYPEHYYSTEIYNDILSFLNTLEVKEVDLEKESRHYLLHQHKSPLATDAFIKKAKKWFNRKNGIIITDTKAFFEEFIDYMGIE